MGAYCAAGDATGPRTSYAWSWSSSGRTGRPSLDPTAYSSRGGWCGIVDRIDGELLRDHPAYFAHRAISAACAARLEPCDDFDRATRDIDRYAANRWALAALEAIE